MIQVAQGKSNVSLPGYLIQYWDWHQLGTPPVVGGLADQPAGMRSKAKYLDLIWQTVTLRHRCKSRMDFDKKATKQQRAMMRKVIDPARAQIVRERIANANV